MRDQFGRNIEYLRLSVTEACNFRCLYCAPEGQPVPTVPPLTLAEIEQIVRASVALGIGKIRVTGGEPLVRRDIVEIVQTITAIDGVSDLSLTTNAFRLAALAGPLAQAGLGRVNVSLDTLRPDRFARIVGRDAFDTVWRGLLAAEAVGLTPLKLNVVALHGINDDETEAFARLTVEHPWHVRFIELMPVGTSALGREFFAHHFISAAELKGRLDGLEPTRSPRGNGPARTYRLPNARGTVGFITPASQHFCEACNRLRVTARGVIRSCLLGAQEMDIREALRAGRGDVVRESLSQMIAAKPEHYPFGEGFVLLKQAMSEIGG